MAGIGDWRRRQQTQAQSFLATGNVNYNPLPIAGSNRTGCTDSSGCASGWACIGGICVQGESGSRSGSGNTSGCGDGGTDGKLPGECGSGTTSFLTMDKDLGAVYTKALQNLKVGDVLLKEGLNGGKVGNGAIGISLNGKCLKTGCSGTSTPRGTNDACCGAGRCCRMGSVVQCFCGDCPPPPQRCSQFCTSYLAANGSSLGGCSSENTCDECSFCTDLGNFAGTTCTPKSGTGPCWCDGSSGNRCDSCSECQESGACTFVRENCYPTPIPPINEPEDDDDVDPCAGTCTTITVCDGEPDPPCPSKSSCRQSGDITVGSRNCRLFEQCDKSNVPPECEECDCNCENDCPDCQICNSAGKCVRDPACCADDADPYVLYRRTTLRGSAVKQSWSWSTFGGCSNNPPGYFSNGQPCALKCGVQAASFTENTQYYCARQSEPITVESEDFMYTGYDRLGCCETNPGKRYWLKKGGTIIPNSTVTIDGGTSSTGGGSQNNCFTGGYHFFEAVAIQCDQCPDPPS